MLSWLHSASVTLSLPVSRFFCPSVRVGFMMTTTDGLGRVSRSLRGVAAPAAAVVAAAVCGQERPSVAVLNERQTAAAQPRGETAQLCQRQTGGWRGDRNRHLLSAHGGYEDGLLSIFRAVAASHTHTDAMRVAFPLPIGGMGEPLPRSCLITLKPGP